MPRALRVGGLLALSLCAGACSEPQHGDATEDEPPESHTLGAIEILDPWAKSAIGVHDAKLFFEFRNSGEPDRLVAASSKVATGKTYFRLVRRDVETLDHIAIPPTETPFELSELGYYIEITGVSVPLVMGKEFLVELRFENAGAIEIPFTSRFHSPALGRRIRAAAKSGDLEALRALRDNAGP